MEKGNLYDEARVLRLLTEGSENAFGVLFDRYRPKIYRLALKFLRSPVLAEEIVQDVFLKIWLKRTRLNDVKNLDSYIFISAKNATLDVFRKLAAKAAAEGGYASIRDVVDDSIDNSMLEAQYAEMVQQTLALLPAQQARVFHLAKIEGLSHEAIAAQMNISKLTVKKHMANALQFIRQRLHRHLIPLLLLGIFEQ